MCKAQAKEKLQRPVPAAYKCLFMLHALTLAVHRSALSVAQGSTRFDAVQKNA
jgi:hypothetical protein